MGPAVLSSLEGVTAWILVKSKVTSQCWCKDLRGTDKKIQLHLHTRGLANPSTELDFIIILIPQVTQQPQVCTFLGTNELH